MNYLDIMPGSLITVVGIPHIDVGSLFGSEPYINFQGIGLLNLGNFAIALQQPIVLDTKSQDQLYAPSEEGKLKDIEDE